MGYDLFGKGGQSRWSIDLWPRVLQLAVMHGWRSSGTILLSEDKKFYDPTWCRSYLSNDGQMVMQTDARRLATALAKALRAHAKGPRNRKRDRLVSMLNKDALTAFIAFCRAGPFVIC